jgi:hypothetical protein
MNTHELIDRRSLALARAIADRIDADPERRGLEKARATCTRWMIRHDNPYIREWHTILQQEWPEVREVLIDPSEESITLRQCNPFAGVLSPRERWRIYREFRKIDE